MNGQLQHSNHPAIAAALQNANNHFRPPPDLKPSEWAERSLRIAVGNAVPGPIRFYNAPYQKEPLDMTANPGCNRITLMWGAQVGKTTLALCAQGYRIEQNPQSQIMMQPSQGDLQTWLETKFNPMVEANEKLQGIIAKPRGRDGVNNQRMKSYPGGFLMFSWSGSPKTMRGRSAPFIVCDETDGYDRTNEGHPVGLLWQRAATFGDQRLLMEISTPTTKGASWIESAYEQGDQRRFYVPCPECGHSQHLQWSNVNWQKSSEGEHLPETACYVCERCGSAWNDGQRVAAVRQGEWVSNKPFRGHASYHLNELYSCFRKLSAIVQSFLDKKAGNDLQTFVNVSLAETWEERGEKVDGNELMQRVERYQAPVPDGGLVLTAGVDMQTDRIEVEVVAWGLGEESWSVDYRILWGDPLHGDVWAELDDLLDTTYTDASGAELPIASACLDTGGTSGYTQSAYQYVSSRRGRRLFAIKGMGGWGRPVVSAPSRKRQGKGRRPFDLFVVGVDEAKVIVSRRLGIDAPGPGYCHFPDSREAEWFHQVTAEKLVTRYIKGFPVREFHKTRERNEGLDCRVYAFAALKILNPNLPRLAQKTKDSTPDKPAPPARRSGPSRKPQTAEQKATEKPPVEPKTRTRKNATKKASPTRRKRKKGGSGWVNDW